MANEAVPVAGFAGVTFGVCAALDRHDRIATPKGNFPHPALGFRRQAKDSEKQGDEVSFHGAGSGNERARACNRIERQFSRGCHRWNCGASSPRARGLVPRD